MFHARQVIRMNIGKVGGRSLVLFFQPWTENSCVWVESTSPDLTANKVRRWKLDALHPPPRILSRSKGISLI